MDEVVILAVDPGTTTGFCAADNDGTLLFADQYPRQEFCTWYYETAMSQGPELHTIVERFTITQRTITLSREGSGDALGIIGMVRWASLYFCERDIIFQQPDEVMRLVTNQRLKDLGWYVPKEHARDTLRHLAVRCAKLGLLRIPT